MEKLEFKGTNDIWVVSKNHWQDDIDCVFAVEHHYDICTISHIDGKTEHFNAHLIAASKDLLEACIALEYTLSTMTRNPVSQILMSQLQHAISKALNTTSNE